MSDVQKLISKASETACSQDAMRFSQAAINVAQALHVDADRKKASKK